MAAGDGARCRFRSINRRRCSGHNDIHPELGELVRKIRKALELPIAEAPNEFNIVTFDVTEFLKPFLELAPPTFHACLSHRTEYANSGDAVHGVHPGSILVRNGRQTVEAG